MNDNKDLMIQAMLNSPAQGEYGGEGPAPSTFAAEGTTSPSVSRRGEPPFHGAAITKDSPTGRVLLWRADSKMWEVGRIDPQYIGHPQYAYTHWHPLPPDRS